MKTALSKLLFGLLAITVLMGCDNTEDDGPTDAERLVGVWNVTAVADDNADQSALFQALGTIQITLNDDGTYRLLIDRTDPASADSDIPGTYTVDDGVMQLTLLVPQGDANVPVAFGYNFLNDIQAEMSISALLLGAVLTEVQGLLAGTVILTLNKA